jgi:hypothetical protein
VNPVRVSCYSGRDYAERPISFIIDDQSYEIETIVKEWREPGTKHFLVVAGDSNRYELCYNERNIEWYVCHPGDKESG